MGFDVSQTFSLKMILTPKQEAIKFLPMAANVKVNLKQHGYREQWTGYTDEIQKGKWYYYNLLYHLYNREKGKYSVEKECAENPYRVYAEA